MFGGIDQTSHFGISVVTADDVKCLQNDSEHHAVNKHELEGTDEELVAANIADNPVKHDPTNHVAPHVEQGRNPIVVADTSKSSSQFLVGAAQSRRRFFPNWRLNQIVNQQFGLSGILRWSSKHDGAIF